MWLSILGICVFLNLSAMNFLDAPSLLAVNSLAGWELFVLVDCSKGRANHNFLFEEKLITFHCVSFSTQSS